MEQANRLSQAQKIFLNEIYESFGDSYHINESLRLNDIFERAADSLNVEPSDQCFLISKSEVHPQIWNALRRARVGKLQHFDNGDEDPEYNKARKVDTNLLEALLALLVNLIQSLTKAIGGGTGDKGKMLTPRPGMAQRLCGKEALSGSSQIKPGN